MKHTILCVDDEIDNVEALERIFRAKYTVLKATSGAQALSLLDQHPEPIALIITDQRMPQMTGVDFLSQSIKTHPNSIRILLTGYTDMESIVAAINSGQIYRYLNKPWDPVDLMNTVDRAVERFVLQSELRQKNIDLAKALTELQALDQAKNQFMILINHELKTPLTSIMSFTELLKESKVTEEQELCIHRIEKSANRLKELIDDVLVIISAETKLLKPKINPFDAQNLLLSLPPYLATSLANKNQTLKRDFPEKRIVADQALLQQAIDRIIHNAIKFGSENSEIEVSAKLTQPHRLKVTVYNQGSQISSQIIDKLLRPFFLDEDVMNHSVGAGLGLTLCQAILKSHGSQLHIENKLGGVIVSFEIPCL